MSEQEPSKSYDPTEVESRWYATWMDRQYFRADAYSDKPPFSIVLPPPNVTGSLHLGHALTATIQDILVRWKRMSGYNCLWLPGTDHAGIATQMVVERELKKTEGKSRHDLGRPAFLERVWKWKEQYGARIGEQHKVLGASLDWSRERFTMDPGLSAAVREVFVRLHEEGLIYRAQKLINWCPSCRTALSDLEVEHEEKDGALWHLKYPVKGTDRHLTVATTRPETMLGDTGVAVHPDDERYRDLIGGTVVLPLVDREIPIIADGELVNPEFGTGVVKVTPAHDFNDYQTGLRHKLPMITILGEDARTNENAGRFAGLDRYEARQRVLEALTEQGLLEKEEPHKLSVGGCQRCGTVVEPRLSPQWFVRIEPLAKPAIQAVEDGRTRFIPETWTNVYFHWMRNIHDWCISRQLWWGHQVPAWYCTDCTPRTGTGSLDYAKAEPLVARDRPERCPKCSGQNLEQDADVLDTWFSSGLWPFSTLGWPAQTQELQTFYPTQVMETGHDIIFFWVARMMMMGLHFMKDVPFRVVYLHAMVRDEKGEKMSKVKGNVIDPLDVVRGAAKDNLPPALRNKFPQGMPAFGADALRFTLAAMTQQGRDIKLSLDRVGGYKAFVNKLWNASRFALMNVGDAPPDTGFIRDQPLSLADRWILSRLNQAMAQTQLALEEYRFSDAANTLYQFLWYEFCDWYVELSKIAFYGEDEEAKRGARATVVFCLDHMLRLLHPFMPFVTEELWQKLPITRDAESIMVAQWPVAYRELEDADAEREMAPVIAAILGLRTIRGESNLPPQTRVSAVIQSADQGVRETLSRWQHYLKPLAGLSEVTIGAPGAKPGQAAAHIGEGMEIYVPLAGLIDLDEERKRLEKEIVRAEQERASIQKKLDNPNFVQRAPPDVVEKDRARVEELGLRQTKLKENLERLAPASTAASTQDRTSNPAPMKHAEVATASTSGAARALTDATEPRVPQAKMSNSDGASEDRGASGETRQGAGGRKSDGSRAKEAVASKPRAPATALEAVVRKATEIAKSLKAVATRATQVRVGKASGAKKNGAQSKVKSVAAKASGAAQKAKAAANRANGSAKKSNAPGKKAKAPAKPLTRAAAKNAKGIAKKATGAAKKGSAGVKKQASAVKKKGSVLKAGSTGGAKKGAASRTRAKR